MHCRPPGSSVCGISRQECCRGLPFPSSGDLPDPGIKPVSPAWQAQFLPLNHLGSQKKVWKVKVKVTQSIQLFVTPWTVAHQALFPWNFPGKNTGLPGCHSLLPGIVPTQGLNLGPLHCRQILLSAHSRTYRWMLICIWNREGHQARLFWWRNDNKKDWCTTFLKVLYPGHW